jgi:hypothetical protein
MGGDGRRGHRQLDESDDVTLIFFVASRNGSARPREFAAGSTQGLGVPAGGIARESCCFNDHMG